MVTMFEQKFNLIKLLLAVTVCVSILALTKAIDTANEENALASGLIPPQINETCLAECSQKTAALHANLAIKYPRQDEEIALFPLSAGFLADFCKSHEKEEACRSSCGNTSSLDPRLRQMVWELPHLICETEYQRLLSKLPCLIEAKAAANTSCYSKCYTTTPSSVVTSIQECRQAICNIDCEKPIYDQRCGNGITDLVKSVRKHAWPGNCDIPH